MCFWNTYASSMSFLKREMTDFLAVCESRNISRAAETLSIQQAGLSRNIQKLERELGQTLLIRKGRGVEITEEGLKLQKSLLSVQEVWMKEYLRSAEDSGQISGLIRIGAHPINASDLLCSVFTKIHESHPALRLELELLPSLEATRQVLEAQLDIGLVVNPIKHPELVIVRLKQDTVHLWGKSNKSKKDVIYYNPEMIAVTKFLNRYKTSKKVPLQSYELIAECMRESQGTAILPSSVAMRIPKLKSLSRPLLTAEVCLVYRADRPKTRAFLETLSRLRALKQ